MGNSLSNDEINARLHAAAEKGDLKELQKHLKKGGDLNKLLDSEQFQKPKCIKPETQSEKGEAFDNFVNSLASERGLGERSPERKARSETEALRMNVLHRAASRKNNLKILQYVLNRAADVDEQDSHGDAALHYVSMFHNNDESVAMVMKFNPNINLQNDRGETALFSAIVRGCDLKVVESLLRGGADPNICNIDGDTPLHACALRRGIDPLIPGILLRFAANPNLKNRNGQTPLHVAAETTNNAVLLLLKFNAKVRLRDNNGRRPSEVASSEDMKRVLMEEENDLMSRTIRTSDYIAAEEAPVFASAPPKSSQSVQNWLNGQNSIDSSTDFERNGSIRSDKGRPSQIVYPSRRSAMSESGLSLGRASRMSIDSHFNKFVGGGGEGVIVLPGNKEVVIPPDAVPLGTTLKLTITSNDGTVPDLSGCDFKFDLKIQLPGAAWGQQKSKEGRLPPVFTGMCLEGDTSWRCLRDVEVDDGCKTCVKFALKKEKCVPIVKRTSKIEITAPVHQLLQDTNELGADSSDISTDDSCTDTKNVGSAETNPSGDDPPQDERFWARQVVVVKEASDTSGSMDGSDVDSFAEEDYRELEEGYVDCEGRVDELDASLRIQHPIDQELATITEEEGKEVAESEVFPSAFLRHPEKDAIIGLADTSPFIIESSTSLDSGYRDSLDLES